jgi:hypothetical protein
MPYILGEQQVGILTTKGPVAAEATSEKMKGTERVDEAKSFVNGTVDMQHENGGAVQAESAPRVVLTKDDVPEEGRPP